MSNLARRLARVFVVSLLALGLGAAAARAQVVDEGYVAISGSTRVDVLDPSTNTFTAIIGGTGSRHLHLSSDGHLLFSVSSNAVQVVDTATRTVLASVPTGNLVIGAVQAANGFIYSCNNASGTVSVIDPSTFTVVTNLSIFCGAIAVTPDGSAVWANSATFPPLAIVMAVIDPATNTFTTFPLGGLFNVNSIAFTPDGTFAYVAINGAFGGRVLVINTATHAQVAVIPVGTIPVHVEISPDGSSAYVANLTNNNVSVIDTATNTVVATVPVGNFPRALAFTADGASAYVTNFNSNSISVIDTASLTVTATFGTGVFPWGIVFQQDSDHDGVTNNHDKCPGTPASETVDANGCSIAQLCPCAGPFGTTDSWNNHGQYVSCVTHSAQGFVDAGLISDAQKDAIVTAAGESSCGKQSCVPTFSNFAFGSGAPFGGNTVVAGVGVTLSSTNTEPFGPTSFRDNGGANPAQVQFTFSAPITEFHLDVSRVRADEFLTAFSIGTPTSLSGTLVNQGGFITTSLPFPNDFGSGRLSWEGINTKNITFTIGGPLNTALAVDQFGLCPRAH